MTIFLCFIAALLEGADIVSMGLAAPSVAKAFGFTPAEMSYILTATIVGLMVGSAFGGRLGDRVGRKRVLVVSFLAFGVFSIVTAQAGDLTQFILVRLACGLGLGGAFPNLIALAAETSRPGHKATGVGLVFAGYPLGGAMLALFVASQTAGLDWKLIFYIGGALPILFLPLLIYVLPESAAFKHALAAVDTAAGAVKRPSIATALFGEGRAFVTLLMWVSYGFTQVVVYLLNNWLPTLMVAKGFTVQQAGMISAFQNLSAALGCVVLAMIADRGRMKLVLAVSYAATALSLYGLGVVQGFWPVVGAAIVVGFFAIGAQLIIYTLGPAYYPTLVRATGVGWAVSVGRLGGIAGPLAAGKLLSLGVAPAGVLLAATPCALLAGAAALTVVFRRKPVES